MGKLLNRFSLAGALAAGLAVTGQSLAAAATTKPAASSTAAPSASADKKAVSARCSAEADKKGLHGKDRKKFRSKCKRQGAE